MNHQVSPPEEILQTALNQHFVSQVQPLAKALSILYFILTVSHAAMLPKQLAIFMVPMALATAFALLCISRKGAGEWCHSHANRSASIIAILVCINGLTHLGMTGQHFQTTNIMLLLIGLGITMVHKRLYGALMLVTDVGWLSIALWHWQTKPGLWIHYAFAVSFATFLSVLFFNRRVSMLRNIETLRWQDTQQKLMLEALATTDALTQVPNRRYYEKQLAKEWARMRREQAEVSVLLMDIDHFKKYNDFYGHQKGDDALKSVAQAIKNAVKRPADIMARYGGEEFVVVLPRTPAWGACVVAERIRMEVEAMRIPHEASPTADCVTLSIGIASTIPALPGEQNDIATADMLVETADKALYQAKEDGRNGYAMAPTLADQFSDAVIPAQEAPQTTTQYSSDILQHLMSL